MGFLGGLGAALGWLGRHGSSAVVISFLIGIALPPLGALVRPFFPETVFLLLCLAFLRVEPAALRAELKRPGVLLAAAVWTMLAVPLGFGIALNAFGLAERAPALMLALMLNLAAPPIFASPALAALMGLNAAVTLAMLIVCAAMTPLLAPALVAAFAGSAVTFSPLTLGLRLVLMLAGAACAATAIRAVMGRTWVERQGAPIDGLNVLCLFGFAVALMGDVLGNTIERPLLVLGILALATALTYGLSALTLALLWRAGLHTALPLAHAAGSRNTGLMLAAAAGQVPELVWLYIALLQIPIYALPLLARLWARQRRLSTGR